MKDEQKLLATAFKQLSRKLQEGLDWEKQQLLDVVSHFRFYNKAENRRHQSFKLVQREVDAWLARLARWASRGGGGSRWRTATVDGLRKDEVQAEQLMMAERARSVVRLVEESAGRLVFRAHKAEIFTGSPTLWRRVATSDKPTTKKTWRKMWEKVVVSLKDEFPTEFNDDINGWTEAQDAIVSCHLLASLVDNRTVRRVRGPGRPSLPNREEDSNIVKKWKSYRASSAGKPSFAEFIRESGLKLTSKQLKSIVDRDRHRRRSTE